MVYVSEAEEQYNIKKEIKLSAERNISEPGVNEKKQSLSKSLGWFVNSNNITINVI